MSDLAALLLSVAAIITAIGTGLAAVITAVGTRRAVTAQGAVLTTQAENIHQIKVETNSMKDALVKKTDEAGQAKGRDEQRAIEEAKAAELLALHKPGPGDVSGDR